MKELLVWKRTATLDFDILFGPRPGVTFSFIAQTRRKKPVREMPTMS